MRIGWCVSFEAIGVIDPAGVLGAAEQSALETCFGAYADWLMTGPLAIARYAGRDEQWPSPELRRDTEPFHDVLVRVWPVPTSRRCSSSKATRSSSPGNGPACWATTISPRACRERPGGPPSPGTMIVRWQTAPSPSMAARSAVPPPPRAWRDRLHNFPPVFCHDRRRSSVPRTGFCVVPDLLSPETIETIKAELLTICRGRYDLPEIPRAADEEPDDQVLQRYLCIHQAHKVSAPILALMKHPAMAAVLDQLIGPHVKCLQSQLFVKPPGFPGNAWHQDERYIPTRDRPGTTARPCTSQR
jgi:hypothetical protein